MPRIRYFRKVLNSVTLFKKPRNWYFRKKLDFACGHK